MTEDTIPRTNALEISVSDLSQELKRAIEDQFGHVRLRGEISNFRGVHSSGHAYFSLKDAQARIDAVIWKGVYMRLRVKPQEGLEVVATGRITTFPGKSSYQIVIEQLEPAGLGALMQILEERRRALTAEGLFDAARKRPLPYLPRVIGVVTSPTGAVIRDILHRLNERFPRSVLVWPVRVQGETSAGEVALAIDGFNALPQNGPIPRPDVLIVARGGGSLEDLWSFNEEIVLRAAARSDIPLISAIGHETDWTLMDHVADRRAPTPTAAAEMAVPVRSELLADLASLSLRLDNAIQRTITQRKEALRTFARLLQRGRTILESHRQRLDFLSNRLPSALRLLTQRRAQRLARAGALLVRHAPQAELARASARQAEAARRLTVLGTSLIAERLTWRGQLEARLRVAYRAQLRQIGVGLEAQRGRWRVCGARLTPAMRRILVQRAEGLAFREMMLRSLGHNAVLERGFALVRTEDGHILRRADAAARAHNLRLQFADGTINAITAEVPSTETPIKNATEKTSAKTGAKKRASSKGQGQLF